MSSEVVSRGLENVIIKTTKLTYIDGNNGILRYGGYAIEDLVEKASYEEVIHLFLYGDLPNKKQLEYVRQKLFSSFEVPDQAISVIYSLPRDSDPMAMMEAAFAVLASIYNPNWDKKTDKDRALEMIAKTATITANVYRAKEGLKPKIPQPAGSYAESFLTAVFDKKPTEEEIKAMDAALVLYADHEVPASTTAALVVSSTLSDIYSSIVAALAALKGPLHGGAAEAAFKQYVEIGSVDKVDNWFEEKIVKGKNRLMGFGHRVYKTYDPRAKIFKKFAKSFADKDEKVKKYYDIAERLEELGIKEFGSKGIYPNTDYYSGIVYYALGFPMYMYTPLFALSRVLGWSAHVIEYVEEQHRLIRPRALYTGPEKREFKPIEQR